MLSNPPCLLPDTFREATELGWGGIGHRGELFGPKGSLMQFGTSWVARLQQDGHSEVSNRVKNIFARLGDPSILESEIPPTFGACRWPGCGRDYRGRPGQLLLHETYCTRRPIGTMPSGDRGPAISQLLDHGQVLNSGPYANHILSSL